MSYRINEIMSTTPDRAFDAFLQDSGPLLSKTTLSIEGNFIGEFSTEEDAITAYKAWTKKVKYYPTLWRVSDHGNVDLVVVDFDKEDL